MYAASSQVQPISGKSGHIYPDFNASMVVVVMVEVVVVLLSGVLCVYVCVCAGGGGGGGGVRTDQWVT